MMRDGENPLGGHPAHQGQDPGASAGLPEGIRIVPFYDRTRLIHGAIETVTRDAAATR